MPLSGVYCDAHCHLHDFRLRPLLPALLADLQQIGYGGAVVDGTCEDDWPAVEALSAAHPWLQPAFGIHPWYVGGRSPGWEQKLNDLLDRHPQASVGETGLDGAVAGGDPTEQREVFVRQWQIATSRNRAASVHCVKAHEPLRQILRRHTGPARGFLLHAWNGPAALTPFLLDCGAHFSFPPYFLHNRKAAQRDLFRTLPPDRILIETDAPFLVPPVEAGAPALSAEDGTALNHPGNIVRACAALAALRGESIESMADLTAANWRRLFAS